MYLYLFAFILLLSRSIAVGQLGNQVNPMPCTGFCTDLQDVTVIRGPNGLWHRFSAFRNISSATATSLTGPWINSSTDALAGSSIISATLANPQNLWSPQVIKIDSMYYLYYAAENYNGGPKTNCSHAEIGVATSLTLEPGSWTDHGSVGIPSPVGTCNNKIDSQIGPSVLADGKTNATYMSFGSYLSDMVGIRMAEPPLTVQSGVQPTLLVADDSTAGPAPNNRSEGSFLWKQGSTYYLFYSDGACCAEAEASVEEVYKIKYCTASAPLGPYRNRNGTSCLAGEGGDLLMMSHGQVRAPGSVSVLDDPEYGTVMFYQYMNASGPFGIKGIKFAWNYLGFGSDGTPVLSETKIMQTGSESATAVSGVATVTSSSVAASVGVDVLVERTGTLSASAFLLSLLSGVLL